MKGAIRALKEQFFYQPGHVPGITLAATEGTLVWLTDGNRAVVVATGIAADDHAVDEQSLQDTQDGRRASFGLRNFESDPRVFLELKKILKSVK